MARRDIDPLQHHRLPRPGPVWGSYPLRDPDTAVPARRARDWRGAARTIARLAHASRAHQAAWAALPAPARPLALAQLRAALRRDGLAGDALARALGAACATAVEATGRDARDTQRRAALAMLDGRMVEMATGEGKTLVTALAAVVAALAGVPVHAVTANEYLAARDAALAQPLAAAMGLRAIALDPSQRGDDAARRAAYAHDIVYATAKDLAFDFLRDRHGAAAVRDAAGLASAARALAGGADAAPVMRGLCLALLDEADSLLLDEAEVPLVLSREAPSAARRAAMWQAVALARLLRPGVHFQLQPAALAATLTPAGEAAVEAATGPEGAGLAGPWRKARYRREALQVALAGLHVLRRDAHYVLRDGQVEILDAVTGRVAEGRVWSRGLHTVVALKEGVAPPPDTETVAQTTFQRFFLRYWRLAGISGTLREARAELQGVYGAPVMAIPLHAPPRRATWPTRTFAGAAAREAAVVARVRELQAAGRPVLVGTDSVADSEGMSACLAAAGIAHRVLNARQDADEAAIVAEAGRAGRVTVATRMAGRGTDIALDDDARAAGGLHVICCQDNPSRRLDRQLAGRAGRGGDPGSTETWQIAVFSAHRDSLPAPTLGRWDRTLSTNLRTLASDRWAILSRRLRQHREERRRADARRALMAQDRHWERRLAFTGPGA